MLAAINLNKPIANATAEQWVKENSVTDAQVAAAAALRDGADSGFLTEPDSVLYKELVSN